MPFRLFFIVFLLTTSVIQAETTGIRGGTEAFRQGEFQRAADAFAEAEKRDADDLRIAFNHGAALFAAGKPDDAVETLRRSATAKDPIVAAKSLALLGRISVDRARQCLAPAPEETAPVQRQTVLDHLAAAERSYSEAIAVRPNDDVRRDLEEIRAWRSRITETWENVDRAQKRSDDMAQRLQWLEEWQEKLHGTVRETVKTEDSPKKFQNFYENAREQSRIAQEIGTAKDELQKILDESQEGDPNHPVLRELDLLQRQAESAEQTLRNFKGEESSELLGETARRINRLRMNLAPYEMIVQEAEKRQAKLCEANRNPSDAVPLEGQVRSQNAVADWMPLMVHRAEQGLEQLAAAQKEPNPNASENVMEPENSVPSQEQTEALRKSMELAVQHGPEIRELTADAAQRLAENEPAEALPKQDQALELLRKILEPLRQQQQNQQQNQNDQNQQQQQNESQPSEGQENEKEEKSKDEQQQNEPQQNQAEQKEPKDKADEKQDEPKESEAKEQKEEQEKAERMLRQVRRRQQEANEKREKIRALLQQLEPVEKDW